MAAAGEASAFIQGEAARAVGKRPWLPIDSTSLRNEALLRAIGAFNAEPIKRAMMQVIIRDGLSLNQRAMLERMLEVCDRG